MKNDEKITPENIEKFGFRAWIAVERCLIVNYSCQSLAQAIGAMNYIYLYRNKLLRQIPLSNKTIRHEVYDQFNMLLQKNHILYNTIK